MKIQILLLTTLLIGLGGCVAHTPKVMQEPWMFYQAYNGQDHNSPAPFFLTIEEAQEYCNKMNKESPNDYQVGFIAR